jgi:hypothetical protein
MPYAKTDPLNAFSGSALSITTPVYSNKVLIGIYGGFFDLSTFFANLISPILDPSIQVSYWVYAYPNLVTSIFANSSEPVQPTLTS